MAAAVVASFNVENLFARPKAFGTADWAAPGSRSWPPTASSTP
jgi:hypothetical protein